MQNLTNIKWHISNVERNNLKDLKTNFSSLFFGLPNAVFFFFLSVANLLIYFYIPTDWFSRMKILWNKKNQIKNLKKTHPPTNSFNVRVILQWHFVTRHVCKFKLHRKKKHLQIMENLQYLLMVASKNDLSSCVVLLKK